MKHFIPSTIFFFLGLLACKNGNPDQAQELVTPSFDTIFVEDKTIIALTPDSADLALLKKKHGEDTFYTIADDKVFYEAQLEESVKANGIQLLQTKSRKLAIRNATGEYELIEKDSLETQWTNYFYYTNDLGLVESSLEELLEAFEPEEVDVGNLRFILEKVSAKETPSFKEAGIFELVAGQVVKAISEMKISGTLSGEESSCYDNTWIEIETRDGEQGWVYGRAIGMLQQKPDLIPGYEGEQLMINGKTYQMVLIKNYSLGASDEFGLVGCPEFYPMVFYTKDLQNIQLAKLINSPHSDFPFCNLVADTGISEKIDSVTRQENGILFKIACGFQEGTGHYDLELREENGQLVGKVKNYQKDYE